MKRFCIIALAVVLGLSLCACRRNQDENTEPSTEATTTAPTTLPTTPMMDPTIQTNIPDPSINTELPDGTMEPSDILPDMTGGTGSRQGNMG